MASRIFLVRNEAEAQAVVLGVAKKGNIMTNPQLGQQNQSPAQKPGQQQGGGTKPGQQNQAPAQDDKPAKEPYDQRSDTDT
jgi:hypothetical protein